MNRILTAAALALTMGLATAPAFANPVADAIMAAAARNAPGSMARVKNSDFQLCLDAENAVRSQLIPKPGERDLG